MPEATPSPSQPDAQLPPRDWISSLQRLVQVLFAIFLVLSLATHSGHWRVGPFTWLPVLRLPALIPALVLRTVDQTPMSIGVLTLVPVLLALCWPALRLLELRYPERRRRWQWGWLHITGPLSGLTLLGMASLVLSELIGPNLAGATGGGGLPLRNTAFQLLSLGVVWFVYLFIVNERPKLTWPLALVVVIQGGVGVAQFVFQHDLGLPALGELALDPEVRGVSVLMTEEGQRWLRAYGLTGHPNLLAALLTVLLLLLLLDLPKQQGVRRALLVGVCVVGVLGLLATVSRAAWLAFGVGLVVWALGIRLNASASVPTVSSHPSRSIARRAAWVLVPICSAGAAFVVFYGRQLATRFFDLNTAVEARSLLERLRERADCRDTDFGSPLDWCGPGELFAQRTADRSFCACGAQRAAAGHRRDGGVGRPALALAGTGADRCCCARLDRRAARACLSGGALGGPAHDWPVPRLTLDQHRLAYGNSACAADGRMVAGCAVKRSGIGQRDGFGHGSA